MSLSHNLHDTFLCLKPRKCSFSWDPGGSKPRSVESLTINTASSLANVLGPCPSLSPAVLRFMSIESMMPSNHLILCQPLLLPSVFPSIRVFSKESVLRIRWVKYWSFSFSISSSNEYSGLISFRIAWLNLLAVQGTLKILLQHHSSKVSILQCSVFMV